MMNIQYVAPLSRAWDRMKKALFQPFDLKKWFVVGFTAFLAGLAEGGFHGNPQSGFRAHRHADFGDVVRFPHTAWMWLLDHTFWFSLIICALLFIIVLIVLFTWLSSRGKFMFLDNVVHDRALIAEPWRVFRMQGDSLFLWRIAFGFICFGFFILLIAAGFILAANMYWHRVSMPAGVFMVIGLVMLALAAILVIVYISVFLNDFIVPIMYRNNVKTNQAWRHFQPLFSEHWMYFILYGLFKLLLTIVVIIGVIIAVVMTCCIGLIFLIIPYINAVVTLPISYTFRAFSVEFLEQFGPKFRIFPQGEIRSNGNP